MNKIKIHPATHQTSFTVYEIHDDTGKRVFSWYCASRDLLHLHELFGNPEFNISPEKSYTLTVLAVALDKNEAYNKLCQINHEKGLPSLNRTVRLNRFQPVKCNETGIIYDNAAHACKELGIHAPRMSNHLNRRPGHITIKNLTFSYAPRALGLKISNT